MKTVCGILSGLCWLLAVGFVGGIEHGAIGTAAGFFAALACIAAAYLFGKKAGAVV